MNLVGRRFIWRFIWRYYLYKQTIMTKGLRGFPRDMGIPNLQVQIPCQLEQSYIGGVPCKMLRTLHKLGQSFMLNCTE